LGCWRKSGIKVLEVETYNGSRAIVNWEKSGKKPKTAKRGNPSGENRAGGVKSWGLQRTLEAGQPTQGKGRKKRFNKGGMCYKEKRGVWSQFKC